MSRSVVTFLAAIALIALPYLTGCDGVPAPNGAQTHDADNHKGEHPEGEHHEGDGHDDHAGSGHATEGPHHGHLIELGEEEFHAELAHDEATKTITVYLLDKAAKEPVSIPDTELVLNLVANGTPTQVKLAAAPTITDPAGQSSRFSLADEAALELLEAPTTTGRLNVTINGKPYSGAVEHQEHGEHEHNK